MTVTECHACGSRELSLFHRQPSVPVNSCLLVDSSREARDFPRGELMLTFCQACGFVFNPVFDPRLAEYSPRYEETQGFSGHFQEFARQVAERWITRFDIRGKDVVEIGCGKGEFLSLMAELGDNRCIGIDPGAVPERLVDPPRGRVTLIPDFYGEEHAGLPADVIVCRHTLEHIAPVRDFLLKIRQVIGDRTDTVVLFELPDVQRVLSEVAFYDVYYEHCSYFSMGSLARLFRRCGFDVMDVDLAYDGQYILLEARPTEGSAAPGTLPQEDDMADLVKGVDNFAFGFERLVRLWRDELAKAAARGARIVLWGGGSKAVSYITNVGADSVSYVVDINPYKANKYIAGSAVRVVGPDHLEVEPPDLVVVMNPVYADEISAELDRRGIRAALQLV
ncbi:MAG TPA: class I SAM-dependent methyltransferase [Mycobacteriales bacterium]|nr:class I SAM-dependent methyltransferase [Mycobacteriales bacterium]